MKLVWDNGSATVAASSNLRSCGTMERSTPNTERMNELNRYHIYNVGMFKPVNVKEFCEQAEHDRQVNDFKAWLDRFECLLTYITEFVSINNG